MADGDLHVIRVGGRTFSWREGTEDPGESPYFQTDLQFSTAIVDPNGVKLLGTQGAHIEDAEEHTEGDGDTDAATDAAEDADTDADETVSDASAASGDPADLSEAVTKADHDANMVIVNEIGAAVEGNAAKYNALANKYNSLAAKYNATAAKYNSLATKFNALRADYNNLRTLFNTCLSQLEDHGLNASS